MSTPTISIRAVCVKNAIKVYRDGFRGKHWPRKKRSVSYGECDAYRAQHAPEADDLLKEGNEYTKDIDKGGEECH
jgi:hypothetical protein